MIKLFAPPKWKLLLLIFIAGNIFLSSCWYVETSHNISGDVRVESQSSDVVQESHSSPRSITVWSTDKTLLEDHLVDSGATLVIEPGVTVYLANDVSLIVEGTLKAAGSHREKIIFTVLNEGENWGEIRFDTSPARADDNESSILNNCVIQHATTGIHCIGSNPHISNTTIEDSDNADIKLDEISDLEMINSSFDRSKILLADEESTLSVIWFLHIDVLCPEDMTASLVQIVLEDLKDAVCHRSTVTAPGGLKLLQLKECTYTYSDDSSLEKDRHTSHRIIAFSEHGVCKQHRVYMNNTRTAVISFETNSGTSSIVHEVNQMNLEATLHDLTDFGTRHVTSPLKHEVAVYIFDHFSDLNDDSVRELFPAAVNTNNLEVEYDSRIHYNFELDNGSLINEIEIVNVVATLEGVNSSSDRQYIVSAHYDTHDLITPGADDDASGIAGLLETARIMSQYEFNDTVKFIAFDSEEENYQGSFDYVQNAWQNVENIVADIQLDMIGYNNDTDYHCVVWCNNESMWLGNLTKKINQDQGLGLNLRVYNDPIHRNSDHRSFWDLGYSAVEIIEHEDIPNWNPYYHTVNDTIDTINFTEVEKITQLALGTIVELSVTPNSPPFPPARIFPNVAHDLTPRIHWTPSVDINGDEVEYHVNIGTDENKKDILRDHTTRDTSLLIGGTELSYGNTYHIEIYATDEKGLESPVVRSTFFVLNTPPELDSIGSREIHQDELLVLNVTATDADKGPVDDLIFGDNTDLFDIDPVTGTLQWRPSNDDVGVHRVNFTVSDGNGGSDHELVTIEVINVNDPPVLVQPMPNITLMEDTPFENAFELNFFFRDVDGTPLAFDHNGNQNVTVNIRENGIVDFSSEPEWSGYETITFTATDPDNETAYSTMSVTVLPLNDPPVLEHIDDIVVSEGETIFIDPNATDIDDEVLKFEFTGVMEVDTWITGYDDEGSYTVVVKVFDGELYDHQLVNITVKNVNRAPVAIGGRNRSVEAGKVIYLDASRSYDPDTEGSDDPGENELTYNWDFGDGGLGDGKSVSHRYEKPGRYTVILTVTDREGDAGTYEITIVVTESGGTQTFYLVGGGIVFIFLLLIIFHVIRKRSQQRKHEDELIGLWQDRDAEKSEGGVEENEVEKGDLDDSSDARSIEEKDKEENDGDESQGEHP